MSHFSPIYLNAFQESIKTLNSSINGCKDIIKLCEIANVSKMCSIDINRSILLADESIYECEQITDHCREHLKNCDIKECNDICKKLIEQCKSAIRIFENIVVECKDQHMNACLDAINVCISNSNKVINLLNELMAI